MSRNEPQFRQKNNRMDEAKQMAFGRSWNCGETGAPVKPSCGACRVND